MENKIPKIQVIDTNTQQVLMETSLDQSEAAYQFAAQMEEIGLDIQVVSPTLSETLTQSLGLSTEKQKAYQDSLIEEQEDHPGSCCFKASPDDKLN
jgi:hypothetical protein